MKKYWKPTIVITLTILYFSNRLRNEVCAKWTDVLMWHAFLLQFKKSEFWKKIGGEGLELITLLTKTKLLTNRTTRLSCISSFTFIYNVLTYSKNSLINMGHAHPFILPQPSLVLTPPIQSPSTLSKNSIDDNPSILRFCPLSYFSHHVGHLYPFVFATITHQTIQCFEKNKISSSKSNSNHKTLNL